VQANDSLIDSSCSRESTRRMRRGENMSGKSILGGSELVALLPPPIPQSARIL